MLNGKSLTLDARILWMYHFFRNLFKTLEPRSELLKLRHCLTGRNAGECHEEMYCRNGIAPLSSLRVSEQLLNYKISLSQCPIKVMMMALFNSDTWIPQAALWKHSLASNASMPDNACTTYSSWRICGMGLGDLVFQGGQAECSTWLDHPSASEGSVGRNFPPKPRRRQSLAGPCHWTCFSPSNISLLEINSLWLIRGAVYHLVNVQTQSNKDAFLTYRVWRGQGVTENH